MSRSKLKRCDRSSGWSGIGRASRAGGRGLLDDLDCPIVELTAAGRLRFANAAAVGLLALGAGDLDRPLLDRLGVDQAVERHVARRLALLLAGRSSSVRVRLALAPSVERPNLWRLSARRNGRGRIVGLAVMAETTVRTGLERRNPDIEARHPKAAPSPPHWFWETDARHRFTYLSERLETMTGIARSSLLGRTRIEVMAGSLGPEALDRHAADLDAHRPFQDLSYELVADGCHRLIRVSGSPMLDEQGRFRGYRGVGWEIGNTDPAAEQVRYLVRHDPLTGLVNRQALGETLSATLERAQQIGGGVALLALDLADFKRVNDSYGHGIGDQLLRQAAARLKRSVAGSDTVARLGGDEFAVVLPLTEPTVATAVAIAERIAERLRRPFGVEGHEIHCGVRIGVTLSPLHGSDVAALLQQADLALHEAKRHDRGVCVFGAELSAATQRRKSIEDALRRALARNEMSLVLQPQFAVSSRALVGCEALLRWRHGRPDEIGPGVFVPIAEETGLIVDFGSWVLREACRLAAGWWHGGRGPRIAVNLSPVQFWNRDLCREVEEALAGAGLPPAALELEITEGVLMRDTRSAADTLNKLNALGVAIALDDFGTGYSSLSYLKKFPIHRLKIDQTFIRDLDNDEDDRQIAKAIIGLGHSLDLEVVAEGVETPRQLAFLSELECDLAQGYLFSRPLTVAAFQAALHQRRWQPAGERSCGGTSSLGVERRHARAMTRLVHQV